MTAAQELPYGFSPRSSVAAEFDDVFDPIHFDEDDYALADEDDDDLHHPSASVAGTDVGFDANGAMSATGTKKSKRANFRKGPQNADKRATHNAVERKRRESLNDRFLELARVLPTTSSLKRPSKAVVISKALDYVYDTVNRERALIQENNDLRLEVDQLRASLGMPRLPPPQPLPERRMATAPTLRKAKKATNGTFSEPPQQQPVPLPTPALTDALSAAAKQEPTSPAMPTPSEPSPPTASLPPASPAFFSTLGAAPGVSATHPSPSTASVASARTPSLVFDPTSISSSVTSIPFSGLYAASPDAHSPATVGSLDARPESVSSSLSPPNYLLGAGAAASQSPFSPAALAAMHPHMQAQAAQFMQAAVHAGSQPQAFNPAAAAAAAAYINPAIMFALQQQQQHAAHLQAAQHQHHAVAAAAAAQAAQQQQLNVSEWLNGYNNAVAAQQSGMFAGVPSPPTASMSGAAHAFEGISF
ncbi:hypothetical protein BMF94_4461 [Rhodotorula taiwanensis]|uniref:BHLH domain-containing protein n=1 Tax=Rhodotorula taiwanensis TaxID=741276 RepID=A0A2S5B775_9BASI|nr:hypothetical protein BMF94_4461 [Rhodotorula taiwanensis]